MLVIQLTFFLRSKQLFNQMVFYFEICLNMSEFKAIFLYKNNADDGK